MSEICETVAVKADNDDGYMVINKSDVTEDHVVIGGEASESEAPNPGTKDALKLILDEANVEYAADASKDDLKALVDALPAE